MSKVKVQSDSNRRKSSSNVEVVGLTTAETPAGKKPACDNRKRGHIPEEQHFERGAAARNQERQGGAAVGKVP